MARERRRKGRIKNRRRQAKRELRNGCSGKKRYVDKSLAVESAKRLMIAKGLPKASIYICPKCSKYHVSKRVRGDCVVVLEAVIEEAAKQ